MIHVIILKQFWQQQEIIEVWFFSKWFKNTSESANCLFYFYLIYTQSHIAFEHFKFANWFFFCTNHFRAFYEIYVSDNWTEEMHASVVFLFELFLFVCFISILKEKQKWFFFPYNFYLISMGSYRNVAFWLVENDGLINISRRYQVM